MNALITRNHGHIEITKVSLGHFHHGYRLTCWACGAVTLADSERHADDLARVHEACVAHVDAPLPTYRGPWVG